MSETWIPLTRWAWTWPTGAVRVAGGAILLMVGTLAPLFTIDDSDRDTFNLFDLGRLGAPLVPLLFGGAVLLVVLANVSDRALPNLLPERFQTHHGLIGRCLLALALAEAITLVLDIAIGFGVVLYIYAEPRTGFVRSRILYPGPAEMQWGMLLLVLGLVLILSGAFDRWRGATNEE
ncbi:hypothetical protein ACFXHA_27355 [Nocardia sp. NPDC059240]|uniref:hypothetical protein n=1 Tax=Nocardia sp. NPDC059240 TaxID=3346786 RepID=UPI003676BBB6